MASVASAKSSSNVVEAHLIKDPNERRVFLVHMVTKLLFEEYLMEPIQNDFFRYLNSAFDMGRTKLPLVQILDHCVKDSQLAQALVIKYANGNMYFSPKGLKWVGDRVAELLGEADFRAAFCIGESVLVARSERGGKVTESYLFKATDDILSRLGVSAETCSAWQLQYLKFNPYFKMEQVTKEGTTTCELKFKSPFNETKPGTWTKGSGADFVRTFVTTLDGNNDFSRYGDTVLVEYSGRFGFTGVLNSTYGVHSSSVTAPFTPEERERKKIYSKDRNSQVRPPYTMDADGNVIPLPLTRVTNFLECSGIGAIFTKCEEYVMSTLVKEEDRYFGAPIGPELEDSPLLVFGVDILGWVDQKVKDDGIKNKQKLENVQRMMHVLQREGVDPIDRIHMGFSDFPAVKLSSDNSSDEPKAKKSRN